MILQREHYNIETSIGNDTTARTLRHIEDHRQAMILQREHYNIETTIGNDTTARTLRHRDDHMQ